ncbi:MAG: peptidylprolyl isomerase [Candidatus Eremiobacteraeota bacterium]|nr:peptidylprolyl isomerase [Candidatus Eremiobacteraeota bacterium]
MTVAKNGDRVKVHYTGTLNDGSVFDSSKGRDPLQFTLGKGEVIPGFEEAIPGMAEGKSKKVVIPLDKAYGPYLSNLKFNFKKDHFPEGMEPKPGEKLDLEMANGKVIVATVLESSDGNILLDANHPMAGKDLTFQIQLMEIV